MKPVANMANSDSEDLDDLINFFQEKEEGSEKERLSENPFSALFPTLEVAQCYSDSHKSPVIEVSSENKTKLQEYINRIRRVRVGRVNRRRSSPMMMGRILGSIFEIIITHSFFKLGGRNFAR